jgi:formate C-acetyltransferase
VPVRLLSSPESRGKVCALLRGFFDLGGQMVQTTPVDSAALRAAQANPEAYGDLLIRIGGYSARFINLSRADQDEIIARGEEL